MSSRSGHPGCFVGPDHIRPNRLVADALRIDPATVVDDLDENLAAFVEGVKPQPPFRPACRVSPAPRAVRSRDPHRHCRTWVCQRVADRFDNRLVEFRVLSFHLEADLLAAGDG